MIQINVKERNAVLLAVITPLCNPVSSSRLHTLILRERVREMGGKDWGEGEGGKIDRERVNGIIIWETEGGRRGDHWYLCVNASQWRSLCISMC